ncbi:MAG: carotenoid biosynthesis protein [Chitinophagaceae bacterium]
MMKERKMILPLKWAVFIAILFHFSGAIGIIWSPYKDWFVQNTALNLVLMAVLVVFTQVQINSAFWIFAFISFITGMITEMIGVNTGWLFGNYEYGAVMGLQIIGVPLLIGINWWIVCLSCGNLSTLLYAKLLNKKLTEADKPISSYWQTIGSIVDGALSATIFDFIMEPVAQKLGFWQWQNSNIPFYNYVCWFFISLFLMWVYKRLNFYKQNHFTIHLLLIQSLFFLALRIYL